MQSLEARKDLPNKRVCVCVSFRCPCSEFNVWAIISFFPTATLSIITFIPAVASAHHGWQVSNKGVWEKTKSSQLVVLFKTITALAILQTLFEESQSMSIPLLYRLVYSDWSHKYSPLRVKVWTSKIAAFSLQLQKPSWGCLKLLDGEEHMYLPQASSMTWHEERALIALPSTSPAEWSNPVREHQPEMKKWLLDQWMALRLEALTSADKAILQLLGKVAMLLKAKRHYTSLPSIEAKAKAESQSPERYQPAYVACPAQSQ